MGLLMVVVGGLAVALGACGGGDKDPTTTPTAAQDRTPSGRRARCTIASPALVARVARGTRRPGKPRVSRMYVVRSPARFPKARADLRERPYFVSAAIVNRVNKPDIATWVTSDPSGRASVFPADTVANDISNFPDLRRAPSKAWVRYGITRRSPGFERSRECARPDTNALRRRSPGRPNTTPARPDTNTITRQ
jgi:hypothetical protein